jgi:methionyl-tRNA synthetase
MNHFYITTPIYYVNDAPHIGHAYTTLLADVLSRYHRLLGTPTHFLTGTDEHGQKVFEAARALDITPQEQADKTVVRFQELWAKLGITHDDFIRTTEPRHTAVVQKILQDLYDKGEIYRGEYEGWYCVSDETFYSEDDLVDGLSPTGRPVEKITESNYFFRMGKYRDWLIGYINDHPEYIQPEYRRNETLGFLRQPLGDLCISRPKTRLPWGVPLPFDEDFVCYVWFDALVNYISAVGYGSDEEAFAKWWPASIHLIGKDILTTHTVYWPTMLHAAGLEQPRTIYAHGWWLTGKTKMSKSLGNVADPMEMADTYGVDALRYFLMAEMTLGRDASFTKEAFVLRYNADLANDLGNLASRALRMVERNLDGKVPDRGVDGSGAAEEELRRHCMDAVEAMQRHLQGMSLDRGLAEVIGAVRAANKYFDHQAPWNQLKNGDSAGFARTIYCTMECLRIVSGLLYPVIPQKMSELRRAIGLGEEDVEPRLETLKTWGSLEPGREAGGLEALFPRIQREKKTGADQAASKQKKSAGKKKNEAEGVALIPIDDFARVRLKVARILEAETVPDADRLLKLQVEIGGEKRQLVAGIAEHYAPDALVGKLVIVVANLQPATIRGIPSQGMVLAAKKGKVLRLLTVDGDLPSGARVS